MEGFILSLTSGLFGAILTLIGQKIFNFYSERKERKRTIFKTLMATRSYKASYGHVEALHCIEIEYNHCKDDKGKGQAVVDAWLIYHDSLFKHPVEHSKNNNQYSEQHEEKFYALLKCMSDYLGYNFNNDRLKKGHYIAKGHALEQDLNLEVNERLCNLLKGETDLPIIIK